MCNTPQSVVRPAGSASRPPPPPAAAVRVRDVVRVRDRVRVVAALTSNNPPTRAVLARESAAVVHGIPVVGPYPAQTQFCLPGSTSGRRSRVSRTTAAPPAWRSCA